MTTNFHILSRKSHAFSALILGGPLAAALTGCASPSSPTSSTSHGVKLSASAPEERDAKAGGGEGKVCVMQATVKNTTGKPVSATSAVVYSKKSQDKNLNLASLGYPSKSSDAKGFNLGQLGAGESYSFTVAVLCSVKDDSPVLIVNHVDNNEDVPTVMVALKL